MVREKAFVRMIGFLFFLGLCLTVLVVAGGEARADTSEAGAVQEPGDVSILPEGGDSGPGGPVDLTGTSEEAFSGHYGASSVDEGEAVGSKPEPADAGADALAPHGSAAETVTSGDTISLRTGGDVLAGPPLEGWSTTSSAPAVSGGAAPAVDPRIAARVRFEYAKDGGLINPKFAVMDPAGKAIDFQKSYDPRYGDYELRFDYPVDPTNPWVTVKVTAPGYEPSVKRVDLFRNPMDPDDPDYYGILEVTLTATPAYRLGQEMAKRADELLGFAGAEGVMCITNAGSVHYQGRSSEDAIEGILNYAEGRITFGSGGLLMLRCTRNEPIEFAFVVKKGGDLLMAFFRDGQLVPLYHGTASRHHLTEQQWNGMASVIGRAEAFAVLSLANVWAEGIPADLLHAAAFHGHLCLGTISGYAMVEVLLKYFPPGFGGSGIEDTSYRVLGVPGGSDDDVFQWLMDATPGKRAYVGRQSTDDPNMVGFIRWDARTKTGTLVVMRFDQDGLRSRFQAETGLSVIDDSPSELHFNAWLLGKLLASPEELMEIVLALDGLTEAECNRLTGGMGSSTVETAWGLDMDYINELAAIKPPALLADPTSSPSPLTIEDIKEIGKEAARKAVQLFREELGIRLEKDDPCLLALTSAGFARLFGLATSSAWDGIYEVLGSRLSRKTLLPVHSSLMGTLWFAFSLLRDGKVYSVYLRYDPGTMSLVVGRTPDGKAVHDIGPETLNSTSRLNLVRPVFGTHFSNIQSIANAMKYDPPFEMFMAYLFHNHVCPGVSPSWLIADHVYKEFPLGEDERYIYLTTVNYCKEDGLIYLLGLSAGGGTYYNLRLKSGEDTTSQLIPGGNLEGILIRWNDELQVGRAAIISFRWPSWDTTGLNTAEARREAQIGAFIQYYKGIIDPRMTAEPQVATETAKWITREELEAIISWAPDDPRGNVLRFVLGLPDRDLSDLIPPMPIPDEGGGGTPVEPPQDREEPSEPGGGEPQAPVSPPEEDVVPETPSQEGTEGETPEPGSEPEAPEDVPGDDTTAPVQNPEASPADTTPASSPSPYPTRSVSRPLGRAAMLSLPSIGETVEDEEKEEISEPTPAAEEGHARAYELEEVTEDGDSGTLALALAGLAAFLLLGASGIILARKRRI